MLASTSRGAFKRTTTLLGSTGTPLARSSATPAVSLSSVNAQRRHAATASLPSEGRSERRRPLQEGERLRARPYQFKQNTFRGENSGTALARYNLELGRHEKDRLPDVLKTCARMKQDGVQPDITTYHHLLRHCADGFWHEEARAILEDMQLAGITPDRQACNYLLQSVSRLEAIEARSILNLMESLNISPDEKTYEILIKRSVAADNLELALQTLMEMDGKGLQPTLESAQSVVVLACEVGQPRLGLQLAEGFEAQSFRRLDNYVWVHLLIASSESVWAEGTTQCWQKTVEETGITPDEGTCMQVLLTAGRHGLPDLAGQVLRVLRGMKVPLKEHHFAPLIEAFCTAGRLSDAFDALDLMRGAEASITPEIAQPIFKLISKDADAVDHAYGVLEQMREQGKTVDVAALNVIVQAAVALGDLQRAVGTYKAASALGVTPDVDTYNLLLAGCISAAHRELGDQLLAELGEAGIVPNARTFERLVVLCLTQENYEDAFYYLEEMKAQKHVPPVAVYEAIVRRCVSAQDTRHELALAEMREMGYEISPALQAFISSSGKTDAPKVEKGASVDEKARLFLESEVEKKP